VKLFLPQKTLEEWVSQDRADLQEGRLVLKEERSSYPVTAAVHFVRVVSGEDAGALVGRVKTESQLVALGAESMADSVVLGEVAYEVDQGYLTEVAPPEKPRSEPAKKASSPEADLLAAFILDKL
jgi:hypothetical protein